MTNWLQANPFKHPKPGDVVRYVGAQQPELAGMEGIVIDQDGDWVRVDWKYRGEERVPYLELKVLRGFTKRFRNPTIKLSREQLKTAKRKISQHLRPAGVRISPGRMTNDEVLFTIEMISELKKTGRLDTKMRILMQSLESPPNAIEIP